MSNAMETVNWGEVLVINMDAGVGGELYPEMETETEADAGEAELELVPIPAERAGWQADRYDPVEWAETVRRIPVAPVRKERERFSVLKLLRNLAGL